MAWYETQLAGVVAGGVIGFIASSLLELYKNWHLKKSLKAGIKSEVKVFKNYLNNGLIQLQSYRKQIIRFIREDVAPQKFNFTGRYRFTFLDRNIEKVGILGESFVSPLIELRSIGEAEELEKYISRFLQNAESAGRLKDDRLENINTPFDVIESTYKHLNNLCDKILAR